ncbi:MAG: NAD(P)-dependent oxidoreductase [Deltaproteobacteria bacterium]|jgi:nucleoside-diphosphate-sugar epimerase|nr:NAD(P)-dependent oxidoreductase [Deltaproteobacteria bacterium]
MDPQTLNHSPEGQGQDVPKAGPVLLIGGAGYVGLPVARELLAHGREVTILDSLVHGRSHLGFLDHTPRARLVEGDARDIGLVNRLVSGHREVVNLAALVGQPACDRDPAGALETNYLAALNVLEACRMHGAGRLVFISTDSCYGTREGERLDELSELRPISLYAELKALAERAILDSPRTAGFSPVVLRLATVYGMSPRPRFDLAVNILVREATLNGRARIFSGEQWRPLVHVDDVARAVRLALAAPAPLVDRQALNVGSDGQNVQFKDLAPLLARTCPKAKIEIVPAEPDLRDYFVKFGKIERLLGFSPSVGLLEGMTQIRDSLLAGFPADPYDGQWRNA